MCNIRKLVATVQSQNERISLLEEQIKNIIKGGFIRFYG